MPARIGYSGFSANRREGDGTTPAGTFGFVYGFGSQPNPGMRGFSFLHQQTGGPTAGCVSLRPKDLVAVVRWLRPGTKIAMGPAGWLNRQ
jgi:L,D-peptidoglycan transpeptidase YkuD (ErfK/YbiS/YcfS/YnhG family)